MEINSDHDHPAFVELRRLAEAVKQEEYVPGPLFPDDPTELVHELEVHQIELEMQHSHLQQAYQKVQETSERYATLFDFAPVGYVLTDQQGVIHQANLRIAAMLGVERHSLTGEKFSSFVVGNSKDDYYIHRRRVFKTGTEDTCELQLKCGQGDSLFVQLNSEPLRDNPDVCLTSITDISHRRQAQETIRRALEHMQDLNDLKSRLISVISHEIRTPLSAILLAVSALDTYGDELREEKKKLRYDSIRTYVWYLNDIINDVVVAHRIGEDVIKPEAVSFQIIPFVEQLVQDLNNLEDEPRIHLEVQKVGHLDLVTLDESLFRRIVINLLQNALKYSADVVHCRLIYEKQKVTLEIHDTGPGIPENDQPHIFEMFYRGSNTTAVRGTGVGLSVVKRATEAHGGAVSFTTGQSGSMFRVKLPRHYMLEPEV